MVFNGYYWKCVIVHEGYCDIGQSAQKYEDILRKSFKILSLNDFIKLVLSNTLLKVLVSFVLFSLYSDSVDGMNLLVLLVDVYFCVRRQ